MFTNLNLTDMEVCYKVFRREVIQGITLKSDRFGFEPEVTAKVARFSFPGRERPAAAPVPDLRDSRVVPRPDLPRRQEDRPQGRFPGTVLHPPLRVRRLRTMPCPGSAWRTTIEPGGARSRLTSLAICRSCDRLPASRLRPSRTGGQQPAAPARARQDPDDPKSKPKAKTEPPSKAEARRDPPGFYMGRQIADVMSWEGVDWLFRETRIEEEQPEAMLDALKIPPGATVADVGAGRRLPQHPPGPAGRPQGNGSGHRRPARDARDAPGQRPRRPA